MVEIGLTETSCVTAVNGSGAGASVIDSLYDWVRDGGCAARSVSWDVSLFSCTVSVCVVLSVLMFSVEVPMWSRCESSLDLFGLDGMDLLFGGGVRLLGGGCGVVGLGCGRCVLVLWGKMG